MRQSLVIATAVATLVAGGAVVAQAATSSTPAPRSAPQVGRFTVVERALTDTTTDTGAKGDSVGDVLTFRNPIYGARNHTRIGSDNGYCVRTAVGTAYECTWTTKLQGGSLAVQGPFYDHGDSTLAITGGTGRWAQARGQMRLHARNAQGTAYDFAFDVRR